MPMGRKCSSCGEINHFASICLTSGRAVVEEKNDKKQIKLAKKILTK